MAIEVIKAGMFASIQDRGRVGYQKFGVNVNGALDAGAARVANILIGNPDDTPVIELTLSGAILKFTEDHMIAICGGNMRPYMNNGAVPMWQPVFVPKDSTISFAQYVSGCRVYIAVAGGFKLNKVLGSYSTNTRARLGGYEGRTLKSGDRLLIEPLMRSSKQARLFEKVKQGLDVTYNAQLFAMAPEEQVTIRYIPGPDFHMLTPESKRNWMSGAWRVDAQSDRMGYRLQGEELEFNQKVELISEGTVPGLVQLPANGQPIVLLSDRQATGGYPRIAVVAAVDIPIFGQLKPGDYIRFESVTLEEAEQLLLDYEYDMSMLEVAMTLKSKF